jgi:XRE family aerobic/anaerobic benzoate catabolism transcriptional regulator
MRAEHESLKRVGDRVRLLRNRRGMTRKLLARDSGVSERYLAQIEAGKGNVSILVMREIARALNVSIDALMLEGPEPPVELVHMVEFLKRLAPEQLKQARLLMLQEFGGLDRAARHSRIALIGLRGAGKSTLGPLLAERLEMPFVELDKLVEQESGLGLGDIFDFLGESGFRRFERKCLEDVLAQHPRFVLATSSSIVSEPGTFERLLSSCFTVWLHASAAEHLKRVIEKGDVRLMADNREAMADLQTILDGREQLYSKADIQIETAGIDLEESLETLIRLLRESPPK